MSATTAQDATGEAVPEQEQGQRHGGDEKASAAALRRWWQRNRAWVLVLTAESFGACMAATARLLEDDEKGAAMHPMQKRGRRRGYAVDKELTISTQIIFVRMALTGILSTIYMRALQYLPLAETTVISFLTPMMIPWAGALLFHERLSKKVVLAGLVSFVGVIIIARPPWLFPSTTTTSHDDNDGVDDDDDSNPAAGAAMRTLAVSLLLMGAVTATVSYTIIRGIGHRAHALISVNYYSLVSTGGSAAFLLFAPGVDFRLPADARQWALLAVIGASGFFLQFLLTAGLQHDRSALATTMMYSQVLYALLFDKLVWGNVPAPASWCGGAVVLASTVYVALWGSGGGGAGDAADGGGAGKEAADEEQGLLARADETDAETANLVNE
ncbi:hypothetical protein SLS58_009813 [Diplodia intermedia]|uniref:EamA domain-containing protein n=1 Tax=Diplodia intermedia TaxID=856260 RepID=A0ABR3TA14_9PEZI